MEILLNGSKTYIEKGSTVVDLLTELELHDQRIAVEVNREVVPRSKHISFILSAGDQIEIIHAVGGG